MSWIYLAQDQSAAHEGLCSIVLEVAFFFLPNCDESRRAMCVRMPQSLFCSVFIGLFFSLDGFIYGFSLHLTFSSVCYNHKIYLTGSSAFTDRNMIPVTCTYVEILGLYRVPRRVLLNTQLPSQDFTRGRQLFRSRSVVFLLNTRRWTTPKKCSHSNCYILSSEPFRICTYSTSYTILVLYVLNGG